MVKIFWIVHFSEMDSEEMIWSPPTVLLGVSIPASACAVCTQCKNFPHAPVLGAVGVLAPVVSKPSNPIQPVSFSDCRFCGCECKTDIVMSPL